ncbi:LysR family transcriptional regulator [Roseateles sp.]|jgi:LysR family nitrogen assimilation transcriptional regulator|uniref:LysR family transcriptional regulator n=1 Tax=Roseateles sp. TaxID=1971397 RepID=UPI0037C8BBE8
MDLKQLEYFVQVAEQGSFSRAAVQLGVAQPALSRQVRALEVELRETLLLRNGRGVTLTEPGRQLLARGRDILQLALAAQQEIGARRDEPVGQIVVGLPPSLARRITVPLIEHFQRAMPRAKLAVVEGFSTHICEWLGTGRVDLGLVYNPEPSPAIEITPVLQEKLMLVGPSAEMVRLGGRNVPLVELARLPLVMPQWGHSFRRLMETQAALAGVKLQIAWEVSSVPTILDLVRRGHGYAALTGSALSADAQPDDLAQSTITAPEIFSTLCLASSSQKRRNALHLRTAKAIGQLCRGDA